MTGHLVRTGAALLIAVAGLVAAQPAEMAVEPLPDPDRLAVEARLHELDQRIADLEHHAPRSHAVGAFARGSTLLVDGGGQESVLERLRRLERDLAAANATIGVQRDRLDELSAARARAEADGRKMEEKADYLAHTQESLEMARSTLAERQERLAAVQAQLAASELQRLRSEREWYQLAADLLRLSPEHPDGLPDIQARVRDRTRDLRALGPATTAALGMPGGGPAGGRHE